MPAQKLILDAIYQHEAAQPERVFLTQPVGGGKVVDYTWGQTLDQARRMAAHLQSRGVGAGSHVAILSKNCAHFFIAELAIWMAGAFLSLVARQEDRLSARYSSCIWPPRPSLCPS
jgi:acyl-CoA synthetase (AMP-forming)/AMP-acid ligase II